jgi:hypothetical protein
MGEQPKLDAFIRLVEPWAGGIKRIITSLLVDVKDDKHQIRFANIWIDNNQGNRPRPDFEVKTQNLTAVRSTRLVSADEFRDYLQRLQERPEQVVVNGQTYELPFDGVGRTADFWFEPLHAPRLEGALRFPLLGISRGSNNHQNLLDNRAIDVELFSANPPFRGIADLIEDLGFSKESLGPGRTPSIEVKARAPITITNEARFENQTLFVAVTVPKALDHRLVSFRTILVDRNQPISRRSFYDGFEITEYDADQVSVSFSQSSESALWAIVYVVYDGHHLGEFRITHSTRRRNFFVELHENQFGAMDLKSLVPISEKFSQNDPAKFENLVALTLSMVGLRTMGYALLNEFNEAPDVLAITDDHDLLVVEVTLGYPDHKGKLLKLSKRISTLATYINDAQLPIQRVVGVMFCGLESEKVDGARSEAAGFGIALFCREELLQLLGELPNEGCPKPSEILNLIYKKIQNKNKMISHE